MIEIHVDCRYCGKKAKTAAGDQVFCMNCGRTYKPWVMDIHQPKVTFLKRVLWRLSNLEIDSWPRLDFETIIGWFGYPLGYLATRSRLFWQTVAITSVLLVLSGLTTIGNRFVHVAGVSAHEQSRPVGKVVTLVQEATPPIGVASSIVSVSQKMVVAHKLIKPKLVVGKKIGPLLPAQSITSAQVVALPKIRVLKAVPIGATMVNPGLPMAPPIDQ